MSGLRTLRLLLEFLVLFAPKGKTELRKTPAFAFRYTAIPEAQTTAYSSKTRETHPAATDSPFALYILFPYLFRIDRQRMREYGIPYFPEA